MGPVCEPFFERIFLFKVENVPIVGNRTRFGKTSLLCFFFFVVGAIDYRQTLQTHRKRERQRIIFTFA